MNKDGGNLDKDLIRELAELLEETGLTEIEIELKSGRFRVARGVNLTTTLMTTGNGAPPPAPPQEHREPKRAYETEDVAVHPGSVTSPMVGTAYRSAEPGAPPFVVVTHHLEEVPGAVTHALLLRDGRAIAQGELDVALTSASLSECFGMRLIVDRRDDGRLTAWQRR